MRDAIKTARSDILERSRQKLRELGGMEPFLEADVVRVPAPRSAPNRDPTIFWPAQRSCVQLVAGKLGREVLPCLTRTVGRAQVGLGELPPPAGQEEPRTGPRSAARSMAGSRLYRLRATEPGGRRLEAPNTSAMSFPSGATRLAARDEKTIVSARASMATSRAAPSVSWHSPPTLTRRIAP